MLSNGERIQFIVRRGHFKTIYSLKGGDYLKSVRKRIGRGSSSKNVRRVGAIAKRIVRNRFCPLPSRLHLQYLNAVQSTSCDNRFKYLGRG